MSLVTTHVLDTALGRPAAGVPVDLEALDDGTWRPLGHGVTDADGRVGDLGPAALPHGRYRLRFDTGTYFAGTGFYPEVVVVFEVADDAHHHVPLLLSPFAYSTYRGS
ncbi:hydroxyisourate hydrolase [Cellulomonas sp. ATA003]|uniref:hydroxyisourate hydrolase n=1 Tax=Cellulomonas sp. ATA003 TaxID=3073064 RepID=UPI00287323A8|nr:hydroxyisourate hydrolase [Cellulomonas sp. ATA003]WNB86547.1 hydroxyisourate hydrolase [Cellulomonas sp. ATA003]